MQENRSFDHYFGTFPGVVGFGDPAGRDMLFQPTVRGPAIVPGDISIHRARRMRPVPEHPTRIGFKFVGEGDARKKVRVAKRSWSSESRADTQQQG